MTTLLVILPFSLPRSPSNLQITIATKMSTPMQRKKKTKIIAPINRRPRWQDPWRWQHWRWNPSCHVISSTHPQAHSQSQSQTVTTLCVHDRVEHLSHAYRVWTWFLYLTFKDYTITQRHLPSFVLHLVSSTKISLTRFTCHRMVRIILISQPSKHMNLIFMLLTKYHGCSNVLDSLS